MRLTRRQLRQLIIEEIVKGSLLAEEEKEEKKEDEDPTDAEALFSDTGDDDSGSEKDEPADVDSDTGEDTSGDSGKSDTEEDAPEEDDSVPADEVEEREDKAEEEGALRAAKSLGKVPQPVALALRDALDDAENAIKGVTSGDAVVDHLTRVGLRIQENSLAKFLFEAEDLPKLDTQMYAQKVANLITNYHTLLDMEKTIFDAAYDQLSSNPEYGREVADEFRNILERDYGIKFDHVYDPEKANQTVYGVGSKKPEGA